jgi:hypothetical protein
VAIGFEGVTHPTQDLVIRDNDFSDLPNLQSFVHNRMIAPAQLSRESPGQPRHTADRTGNGQSVTSASLMD